MKGFLWSCACHAGADVSLGACRHFTTVAGITSPVAGTPAVLQPSALQLATPQTQAVVRLRMVQTFMSSGTMALDEQLLSTGGLVPWFKVQSLLSVPSMWILDEEASQALLQAQPNCFLIKTSGPTFFLPATLPYVVGASVEYRTQDKMQNASGVVGCPGSPDTPGDAPLQARSTGAETLCLQAAFPGVLGTHNFSSVSRASDFRRTAWRSLCSGSSRCCKPRSGGTTRWSSTKCPTSNIFANL